ncbi:MAG: hypothetical protein V4719_00925 [Planctomycetota bacterium]
MRRRALEEQRIVVSQYDTPHDTSESKDWIDGSRLIQSAAESYAARESARLSLLRARQLKLIGIEEQLHRWESWLSALMNVEQIAAIKKEEKYALQFDL